VLHNSGLIPFRKQILLLAAVALLAGTRGTARILAAQSPSLIAQDDPGVRALVSRLQQTIQAGNPEGFLTLLTSSADRDRAARFANDELRPGVTHVIVVEEDRQPLADLPPGAGLRLMVDAFTEYGNRARVTTWQLDIRRAGAAWGIDSALRLSAIENLYRLSVNAAKQYDAKNFTIVAEDLELKMAEGSVFTIDTDRGITGVVLIGEGQMRFHPAPAAEKGQVKIFCGSETLDARFDAAYVRVGDFDAHTKGSTLVPRAVEPRDVKRAEQIFREESVKSFGVEMGDLTRDAWALLPGENDFLAEIRTRKYETLTYSRSEGGAEDISFFDRRRLRNISVYPSVEKLAARGRFYNEDDLSTYDILDYDVDVSLTPQRQWITGRAKVRLKIRSAPAGQIQIHLANSLAVQSITSDRFGRLFSLRIKNQNTVLVNMPALLMPDTDITLTIAYAGRLPPQPANQEAIALGQGLGQTSGNGNGAPAQPSSPAPSSLDQLQDRGLDASDQSAFLRPEPAYLYSNRTLWYPQAPVTDYATGTLRISVPAELTCIASGEPASDSPKFIAGDTPSESRRIFTFVASRPVRYFSFVVSKLVPTDHLTMAFDESTEARRASLARNAPSMAGEVYSTIDVAVFTNPRQTQRAHDLAERTADIARFYQSLIGDSPYQTFAVAMIESMQPGGHSPGYFAVLNQPLPNAPVTWRDDPAAFSRFPDFFIAHELAHQWWGQAVGWRNYHEQWLSEGLAQYFAALYAQHERGDETFGSVLRQMRKWSIDESDQGPVYFGYRVGHIRADSRAFRAIIYDKGAIVLHMLRRLIGDDAFFQGLRHFYAVSRFDKASTDDLRLAMEGESGQKLDRFFDRWIYGSTLPRLKFTSRVEHAPGPGEADQLLLHFEQIGDVFDIPVTVAVQYANRRTVNVVVPVTEQTVDVRVPLAGVLRSVEVSKDDGTLAEIENSK
jgi:peptidase M1-like protein